MGKQSKITLLETSFVSADYQLSDFSSKSVYISFLNRCNSIARTVKQKTQRLVSRF